MNTQNPYGAFRARAIRLPRWQMVVIGALAAALVISLAVFATAVFLIVFPAMIALDWFYRWRTGKSRKATASRSADATIITADYEVLPPEKSREER
jgi:hypothetical protein